jgi:putative ABC transport system permease protein
MLTDLRFALRQLLKYRGFTAVAVLTLGLGIGVNTTMFSVLNALVLQGSAAPDSGRLVSIVGTSPQSQQRFVSPGDFYDYQGQSTSFEQVGAYYWNNFNLAEPGQPAERLAGMSVSGNFFPIFGIAPALGRVIGPENDKAGAGQVAVLSDGFWRSHFAADPGVIGRTLRMDSQQVTIIGVMPADFDNVTFWGHIDLWQSFNLDGATRQGRDNGFLWGIARLKRGVTLGQASAEANAIAGRLAHDFPQTDSGYGLRLAAWNDARVGALSRNISWLCMGLAGFVLLIACANLANLQLARMADRVRENAVRIALGASRLQLIRQLMVESLLLSVLGGAFGVLVASWGVRLISREIFITGVAGFDLPISMDVLLFTLAASAVTGIVVGTVPALIASRTDVNAALKQGSRGSTGDRSRHLLRKGLIVSEMTLALVLLAGAAFFVRGTQRLTNTDMGWKPGGLMTASLSLPFNANYLTDAQCRAFFDKLSARMDELPGTQKATISTYLPITGFWRTSGILVEGRPAPKHGREPLVYYNSETPGNIANLGMHIVRGRDFTSGDRADSRPVALINEAMARSLWPGEDPIGKRIADATAKIPAWLEIVGVTADIHTALELVRAPDTPYQVHLPLAQTPSQYAHWFNLAIRSSAPDATVAAALRAAVQQIDPDQPVYDIVSARESMQQITRSFGLTGKMLGVFALVGLALSAVGIFGVIANLVAQRTSEIGIRMALGAQANDILWLVLGEGLRLAAIGISIGLACAWGLFRFLDSILPSMHGGDPATIACVVALLAGTAALASWLPSRRATKVDPIIALRAE